MATANNVKDKINGLIGKANAVTGRQEATLTGAVDELIAGYGSGSGGITPIGTINITANGTYDVTRYANADVAIPGVDGDIEADDLSEIHVWEKYVPGENRVSEEAVADVILSYSSRLGTGNPLDSVDYSDAIRVVDGALELAAPVTKIVLTSETRPQIVGKYIYAYNNSAYYRIPSGAVVSYHTSTYTDYVQVDKAFKLTAESGGAYLGVVVSTDASAYPNDGEQDGYRYMYLGTMAETGGVPELPDLTNPGTARDMAAGKELIDGNGDVVTGSLFEVPDGETLYGNNNPMLSWRDDGKIEAVGTYGVAGTGDGGIVRPGAKFGIRTPAEQFGNATPDDVAVGKTFTSSSGLLVTGTAAIGNKAFYIATDYGISTESDDNTPALQALIDMLHEDGGGVIWVPVGTYKFKYGDKDADDKKYAVVPKSGVSIMGENMVGTVFKQVDPFPYGMFTRRATADDPLVGCHFERFTVDAYETGDVNQVYGKAFHCKYVQNCVFRDLILRGTTATAMGIDFLDQVVIDNVTCIDCGRTYTGTEPGTSGIGIGTGGWEHENFIVTNCVCVGCGQYGIFIENQTNLFGYNGHEYSKGVIISSCVVRNGLNNGIGIRGGENVTVIGCETYENTANGIYLDNKCRNVHIMSVSATANNGHGIILNTDPESEGIYVNSCVFSDNDGSGIHVFTASDKLCIRDNTTRDNTIGLYVEDGISLNDCVIWNNVCFDGTSASSAVFTGVTKFVDIDEDYTPLPSKIALSANDFTLGIKLENDGSEGTTTGGQSSGYLDVRGISGNLKITSTGTVNSMRVCQYDSDKNSLVTNAEPETDNPLIVKMLDGCAYIRIYYSSRDGSTPATIQSVVIEGVASTPTKIELSASDFTVGVKINEDGSEGTTGGGQASGYLDVSNIVGSIKVTTTGNTDSMRVCQYDSGKNCLDTDAAIGASSRTITMLDGCAYIRIYYSSINGSAAMIESVVVEQG